jgi:m7GpppX diphosphatase
MREGQQALVVLQKRDWVPAMVEAHLAAHEVPLALDVHNAEYFQFVASFPRDCDVKITWPATSAHVDKWRQAVSLLVRETPAMYSAVTERFVAGLPAAQAAWVDNVLEGRREADRVWLQHPDFVIVPDFKVRVVLFLSFLI